jgi:hypothetical protein
MDTRPKTIICDIDGTLIEHSIPSIIASGRDESILLKGTLDKINEWERKGYNIILLTGRKESMRNVTIQKLSDLGIYYDHLIMGVGGGQRYLINDRKPSGDDYAFAININRNEGISNIDI